MTEPTKGSKIGNYEILSELGRGGMGIVYKAHEQSLQRVVALKVLPPHLATNDDFVKRFLREARSAAQLNHPNIVITHAVGESDGHYYIAMEFVKGSSLIDLIREQGQLNIPNALKIVGQVAQALLEAHRHNIIHRDIKPHNIMIDLTGRARVMDFGLAYIGDQSAKLTRTQRKTRRSPSKPHPSTRCQTRHATPNHPNAKTSTSSHHNTPAHNDRCLRSMGILPPRNRLRHPQANTPPPPDELPWKVLTQGNTATEWMARDNSGNMGQWSMLDGVISNHIAPNGSMSKQSPDLKTIEEYQDFELTLDYQIASNANSGIFLRGNVEIQLVGKDHPNSRKPITANGSIYNHFSPLVDPSKPAEQWNKMYIRYQGSEITARINDFTIHNGRTVKQETSNKRSLPNPENFTGPIILQNHTGKISFRNIHIRPITTL